MIDNNLFWFMLILIKDMMVSKKIIVVPSLMLLTHLTYVTKMIVTSCHIFLL